MALHRAQSRPFTTVFPILKNILCLICNSGSESLLIWVAVAYVLSCSVMPDFVILWTITLQAPLYLGFSRQGYWCRLQFPPPGGLPNPGIEPNLLFCVAGGFFTAGKPEFSSIASDSLLPHGLQHARPPCSSPTPRVYSNSCLLSR